MLDNLLALLKRALYFAAIYLLLLMAAAATGCSLEVDDHTHDFFSHDHGLGEHEHQLPSHTHGLVEHEHDVDSHTHEVSTHYHADAVIVSIDPPIDPGSTKPRADKLWNIGFLPPIGWQTVTVIFSHKPVDLRIHAPGAPIGDWQLVNNTLEISVSCHGLQHSITTLVLEWHSGGRTLNYHCKVQH